MRSITEKIENELESLRNYPSVDNYYFFRGYIFAMFTTRNISEKQLDYYLSKSKEYFYQQESTRP